MAKALDKEQNQFLENNIYPHWDHVHMELARYVRDPSARSDYVMSAVEAVAINIMDGKKIEPEKARAYFFTIAKYIVFRDWRTKNAKHTPDFSSLDNEKNGILSKKSDPVSQGRLGEDLNLTSQFWEIVDKAKLSENEYKALFMFANQNMDYATIAEVTDTSRESVRQYIAHARKKLKHPRVKKALEDFYIS